MTSFGLIATEKGFNLFVAGNGGAKPKHSELLAKDVPPAEVIPILDRYLMFYIRTADKLQRTARWIEQLPGGLKYLQDVVLHDKLGICASLEAQMQELVDSFFDEWAEAINNPQIAKKFKQFANTEESSDNMEAEPDRGQARPVMWAKDPAEVDFKGLKDRWSSTTWQPVIEASYFAKADSTPNGISANIKRGDTQLALWRVKGKYYATQQMCPHKRTFALSDGLIGVDPSTSAVPNGGAPPSPPPSPTSSTADAITGTSTVSAETSEPCGDVKSPWVSCPFHKRNFDLSSGACKNDSDLSIATFLVQERDDGMVYIKLPPVEELDRELGTKKWMVKKGEAGEAQFAELDKKIGFKGLRAKKPGVKATGDLNMRKPVEVMAGSGSGCGGPGGIDW